MALAMAGIDRAAVVAQVSEEGSNGTMDFSGTHTFAGHNPQQVWAALHNADIVKKCIPGIEQLSWDGDSAVNVQASVNMGPMSRDFYGTIPVTESNPPNHMRVELHRNIVDGICNIELAPNGAGTLLTYTANVNVSGPIGAVANMAKGQVDGQVQKFFNNLEANM